MVPKTILLLGATGPAGVAFLRHALTVPESDLSTIYIYARTPSRLPPDLQTHPRITILPPAPLSDASSLRTAVSHRPDTIVSLLGPSSSEPISWGNPFSKVGRTDIFADAYRVIVDAMKEFGVKRLLVMGTISIEDSKDKWSLEREFWVWLVWAAVHKAWRNIISVGKLFDSIKTTKEDQEGGVDWTMFRIGLVKNGAFESVVDGYVGDGKTTLEIKREELARWLVENAIADEPKYVGEKPIVSSGKKVKGGE